MVHMQDYLEKMRAAVAAYEKNMDLGDQIGADYDQKAAARTLGPGGQQVDWAYRKGSDVTRMDAYTDANRARAVALMYAQVLTAEIAAASHGR